MKTSNQKQHSKKAISLTTKTLIGAALGILAGVLFGYHLRFLDPIGNIYIRLM